MNDNKQPLGQTELPQCDICHLQPVPQSVQHIPFIVIQVLMLFYSIKLTIITFFLSYCFAKNSWFCPQCRRQIQITQQIQGSSQNLVLRFGNCMIMLSRFKFRFVAAAIISYVLYLYILEIKQKPKFVVDKTWKSIASNCGYEAMLQNPFKANTMYAQYPKLGQWVIEGIYLREQNNPKENVCRVLIKMDPSQFKNPMTEDVVVIETGHSLKDHFTRQLGDVLKITGQWEGRDGPNQLLSFVATKVEKTGIKQDPQNAKLLNIVQRFIRVHEQQKQMQKSLSVHNDHKNVEQVSDTNTTLIG